MRTIQIYGSALLNASRSYAPTAQGADAGTPCLNASRLYATLSQDPSIVGTNLI
jgi:hypothetical protein